MFKPSSRALWVASAFTIGAVCLAPAASASLLDSGSGGALSGISGVTGALPLSGNLLAPVQSVLGGGLPAAGLLNAGLLGNGLPVLNSLPVLGGSNGGLGGLTGILGGGGLPLLGDGGLGAVTGLLGGGLPLGGVDQADSAGGEMADGVLSVVTDTTLACDAAIPQVLSALLLGDLTETICAPFDNGVLGLLSSL